MVPILRAVEMTQLDNTYEVLLLHSKTSKHWISLFSRNKLIGIRLGSESCGQFLGQRDGGLALVELRII